MIQFPNVTATTCVSMWFTHIICTFFTWENYKEYIQQEHTLLRKNNNEIVFSWHMIEIISLMSDLHRMQPKTQKAQSPHAMVREGLSGRGLLRFLWTVPCPIPHRELPSVITGVPGHNTCVAERMGSVAEWLGRGPWISVWLEIHSERMEWKPRAGALLGVLPLCLGA